VLGDPGRVGDSRPLYYGDGWLAKWKLVDGTAPRRTDADLQDENRHLAKVRVDYVIAAKWLLRVRPVASGQNIGLLSSDRQQAPPLQGRRCPVGRQGT
jgi:hypothetical protein